MAAVSSVVILLSSSFGAAALATDTSATGEKADSNASKEKQLLPESKWDFRVYELVNKSSGFAYFGASSLYTGFFAGETGNGSRPVAAIVIGNYTVGYAPTSKAEGEGSNVAASRLANVSASTSGPRLTYPAALGSGVDVRYQIGWNGLKEVFVLSQPPAKRGNLTIHGTLFYDTSNLTIFVDGEEVKDTASTNGTIEFRNSHNETVIVIPKGWVKDSSTVLVERDPGLKTETPAPRWSEVTYALKRYGDVTYFDVTVLSSFLFDTNTTYPIEVDPSLGPYIPNYQEYNYETIEQVSDLTILGGGALVLRNSSFTWMGPFTLSVQPGGTLILDNTTMESAAWVMNYQLLISGQAEMWNTVLRGRLALFDVNPPVAAPFKLINTNVSGGGGDCLHLLGMMSPVNISGSTIYGCGNAGLVISEPPTFANTWNVSDSRFNDSLYGIIAQNGNYNAATFDRDTFEHNRIAGFTADNALATVTNCQANRNARGWSSTNNAQLTVTTCAGDGNAVAAYVVNAVLQMNQDTITNSSVWDYYAVNAGGGVNGGNFVNWVTLTQNSNLTFRHELVLKIVDAAANPLSSYRVYVEDRFGSPAAPESKTNASGYVDLFVSDRRIQPDNSVTFYTPHTIHLGFSPGYSITSVIDSNWNLTLYATGDADNDTLSDSIENNLNHYWFESTNHLLSSAQRNDSVWNLGPAARREASGYFLKEDTFPQVPAGTYRFYFEAWTNTTGAPAELLVLDENSQTLLSAITFALNASGAWYASPSFALTAEGKLRFRLKDVDLLPQGAILIGSLLLARVKDGSGSATSSRAGQITNPVLPDTDSDGAADGIEHRNRTVWVEAEHVAATSYVRVLEGNASSGAAAEHPSGSLVVVDSAFDDLQVNHVYGFWVRAKLAAAGISGRVELKLSSGSTASTVTVSLGSAYVWLRGPNWTADGTGVVTVTVTDLDDPDASLGPNYARIDAILLADLNNTNEYGMFSHPLAPDSDFDALLDGPELGGFYTADFVNASEGTLSPTTQLSGRNVVLDQTSDWTNISVGIRYAGDYRFHIHPGLYAADARAPGNWDRLKHLLLATLTDTSNTEIVPLVEFPNLYFGSSKPPTLNGLEKIDGWYSWVYPSLGIGTYRLKLWINATANASLPAWMLFLDRVYVEKRTLDPLNPDFEADGVGDGLEVDRKTFPLNADSDYDHLTDFEELFAAQDSYKTDPLKPDTDGDGLWEAVESRVWGDFNTSTSTDPTAFDSDGDGLPDGWVDGWSYDRALNVSRYTVISFKDGIRQPWEGEDLDVNGAVKTGAFTVDKNNAANSTGGETDPNARDTDSDGMPDGWELWVRAFNTTAYPYGNDPLILNPLVNDSDGDADVNQTTYAGDPDGLQNLKEYLAKTWAFFPDTDGDHLRDGDEVKVMLRTNVSQGFVNSSRFAAANNSSWVYFDRNPYDSATGTVYWHRLVETNVSANYPGSLFFGAEMLYEIVDGGAVLYNANTNRVYVWEAGSEYAYTGLDSYHNGTVHVFEFVSAPGGETNAQPVRGYEGQEVLGKLDPTVEDSDADLIVDGYDGPLQAGANRWNEDRDGDGLINALDTDSDADGLPEGIECAYSGPSFIPEYGCTNPFDPDTDHDGLSDASDASPLDFDNDGLTGYGAFTDAWGTWLAFGGKEAEYNLTSLNRSLAWDNPDTDGDGLSDGAEDANHNGRRNGNETNALDVDSDDDGLWDGSDVFNYSATVKVEAESASSPTSGVAVKSGLGASNGSYTEWTGYYESATYSLTPGAGYYQLELALADDGAPSNGTILGRFITVEVTLDGVFLNRTRVEINATVHLSSVFFATASPLPIWNGSTHTLVVTVIRSDQDYRFHLDYLRLVPYHPGERNVTSLANVSDSDGDTVQDGAERALTAALVQGDTQQLRGTDLNLFVPPLTLALSLPSTRDSDGDGLEDGPTKTLNATHFEAEDIQERWNTQVYNGVFTGVTTLTTSAQDNTNRSYFQMHLYLEPGYYELTGKFDKYGCQSCNSTPTYRTMVYLNNALVGKGVFTIPSTSTWVVTLAGAFFVLNRGWYELRLEERYNADYARRFTVDYLDLTRYAIGESSKGTNPSDPDTDRDLYGDGAEVLNLTDPARLDTDGDGLPDSQEALFGWDYDGDSVNDQSSGVLNSTDARDTDRDNDGYADGSAVESYVVFRTNATHGMYNESGVWVAVDVNNTHALNVYKFDAAVSINYSAVTKVTFWTNLSNATRQVVTPEGYPLYKNAAANYVYIDLPVGTDVRYEITSASYAPADATGNTVNSNYMLALHESLNWSLMLKGDNDADGVWGSDDPCPNDPDCDGDGVWDGEEFWNKTNASDVDTDDDGLWDGGNVTVGQTVYPGESTYGTNALLNDTDLDGLLDGYTNTTTGRKGELNHSTNPSDWDTDGDGMPDGWEMEKGFNATNATDGWLDADNDGFQNTLEYSFGRPFEGWEETNGTWGNGTNVSFWDSDNDTLPDGWEYRYGLDPKDSADSSYGGDGDFLTALQEYRLARPTNWNEATSGMWWNGSNPRNSDTDGDNMTDWYESTRPSLDPDNDGVFNWRDVDSDNDQLNDSFEWGGWYISVSAWPTWWNFTHRSETLQGLRYVQSDPYSAADIDGDTLGDRAEYENLTDPNNADSDYDGLSDGADANKTSVEGDKPEFTGAISISLFRTCKDGNICEDLTYLLATRTGTFAWFDYIKDSATSTFIFEVKVPVRDNAGLGQVEVYSLKSAEAQVCDYGGGNGALLTSTCTVQFHMSIAEKAQIEFSNMWSVYVIDRNGFVNSTVLKTGWGLALVVLASLPIYLNLQLLGPFFAGVGVGMNEGVVLFGFGLVTAGLPFMEWLMSEGGEVGGHKTQFGTAIVGFFSMLVRLSNPVTAMDYYQEEVYSTAMTESIIFNPYNMTDPDRAAIEISVQTGSRDPVIDLLWNATVDALCGTLCGGPGNSSDWAKFTAGHAGATVAVVIALTVITLVVGAKLLAQKQAAWRAQQLAAPRAAADLVLEATRRLPQADRVLAEARANDPLFQQKVNAWTKIGEHGLNLDFRAFEAAVDRVGLERATHTWIKLFSDKFAGERPTWMLRQKAGAEPGVMELKPEYQSVFDAISRIAGREGSEVIREAVKATKDHPTFWTDNIGSWARPGEVHIWAKTYADRAGYGTPPSVLRTRVESGERLAPIEIPEPRVGSGGMTTSGKVYEATPEPKTVAGPAGAPTTVEATRIYVKTPDGKGYYLEDSIYDLAQRAEYIEFVQKMRTDPNTLSSQALRDGLIPTQKGWFREIVEAERVQLDRARYQTQYNRDFGSVVNRNSLDPSGFDFKMMSADGKIAVYENAGVKGWRETGRDLGQLVTSTKDPLAAGVERIVIRQGLDVPTNPTALERMQARLREGFNEGSHGAGPYQFVFEGETGFALKPTSGPAIPIVFEKVPIWPGG